MYRRHCYNHDHHQWQLPCLHCHPHGYIRVVQHLIERCLLLKMSHDQCVKALAYHARIKPLVTHIVWKELLKENRGFFQAYYHALSAPTSFNNGRLAVRQYNTSTRFTRRRQWR